MEVDGLRDESRAGPTGVDNKDSHRDEQGITALTEPSIAFQVTVKQVGVCEEGSLEGDEVVPIARVSIDPREPNGEGEVCKEKGEGTVARVKYGEEQQVEEGILKSVNKGEKLWGIKVGNRKEALIFSRLIQETS